MPFLVNWVKGAGILCLLLAALCAKSQDNSPVGFEISRVQNAEGAWQLEIAAQLQPGVKLYASRQESEAALSTVLEINEPGNNWVQGSLEEITPASWETDPVLETVQRYHLDSALWRLNIRPELADSGWLAGRIEYMYQVGDAYLPGEKTFRVFLPAPNVVENNKSEKDTQSLWWIFISAFGGGLLALLTPCIYSMIPVTVSFFTGRSESRGQGIQHALYYALSIIGIFTLLGFLITLVFGPAALNKLSTNWVANLVFFAVFLLFGISFLGAFEIRLPSSWTNKAGGRAGHKNFWGIFFMALTLVLVSFSCTGPIIGNLLVLAAQGNYWGPLTGMFGFSLALATPFALFAFFPSRLKLLSKPGGWLNAVKVTLGILELALALKFLSNADLAKGWRLLDREVFLSLWIVLFLVLGIYLLGKIKFHHDDELPRNDFGLPYLPVSRLLLAITSLSFMVYMIPGLWGAPLKAISAFLPPMGTQDFSIRQSSSIAASHEKEQRLPHPKKYMDQMKMYEPEVVQSMGLVSYFDYEEALQVARETNRPLLLDFTGINCVNCRRMEAGVWSDPEVLRRMKDDFVIASLYVDAHAVYLPEAEQYFSEALDKKVETLGDRNTDLQVTLFGSNSQPNYFFIDATEKPLLPEGYGYDPSVKKFIELLDRAKDRHKKL